jgi:hypothetical protein
MLSSAGVGQGDLAGDVSVHQVDFLVIVAVAS